MEFFEFIGPGCPSRISGLGKFSAISLSVFSTLFSFLFSFWNDHIAHFMVYNTSCRLYHFFFFCLPVLFQKICLQVQKSFLLLGLVCCWSSWLYFLFHSLNSSALGFLFGSFLCYLSLCWISYSNHKLFSWFCWTVCFLVSHWDSLSLFWIISLAFSIFSYDRGLLLRIIFFLWRCHISFSIFDVSPCWFLYIW